MDVDEEEEVSLGWKVAEEGPKKRKGKERAQEENALADPKDSEEAQVSVICIMVLICPDRGYVATAYSAVEGAIGAVG